jgi:hypothetical protein
VFRGPSPRRLTAEQFMDAVWGLTGSGPQHADAKLPGRARRGRWIWSHADASRSRPAGESVRFRHRFALDAVPESALAVITADNEYELLVNGEVIASDAEWQTVETVDLGPALRAGTNWLLVRARNLGESPNPAGLYVEAVLRFAGGAVRVIASDPEWLWTDGSGPPQAASAVEAQEFLGPEVNGQIERALAMAERASAVPIRASLVAADPLMRALGRPSREQIVSARPRDLTTLEALHLTNGPELDDLLRRGAERLVEVERLAPDELVERVFLQLLARRPAPEERALALEIIETEDLVRSAADFLWTMLMLPEFQLVP